MTRRGAGVVYRSPTGGHQRPRLARRSPRSYNPRIPTVGPGPGEDAVKPAPFEYFDPSTLPEALTLLEQYGDEGKVLAGGQSLLPLLYMRLAQPRYLVDVNRVEGLAGIRVEGDTL